MCLFFLSRPGHEARTQRVPATAEKGSPEVDDVRRYPWSPRPRLSTEDVTVVADELVPTVAIALLEGPHSFQSHPGLYAAPVPSTPSTGASVGPSSLTSHASSRKDSPPECNWQAGLSNFSDHGLGLGLPLPGHVGLPQECLSGIDRGFGSLVVAHLVSLPFRVVWRRHLGLPANTRVSEGRRRSSQV